MNKMKILIDRKTKKNPQRNSEAKKYNKLNFKLTRRIQMHM